MMAVVSKRAELRPFHARLVDIRALAESCGRQLGAWLRTVRQTDQRACRSRPRNGPAAKARLKRQLDRANLSNSMPPGSWPPIAFVILSFVICHSTAHRSRRDPDQQLSPIPVICHFGICHPESRRGATPAPSPAPSAAPGPLRLRDFLRSGACLRRRSSWHRQRNITPALPWRAWSDLPKAAL